MTSDQSSVGRMNHPTTPPPAPDAGLSHLLASLGQVIQQAHQRAMQAVDVVQVQTCWELGRHIVELSKLAKPAPSMASACCPHSRKT